MIDLAPTRTEFQRESLDFLQLLYTTHKLVYFQRRRGCVAIIVQYTLGQATCRKSSWLHLPDSTRVVVVVVAVVVVVVVVVVSLFIVWLAIGIELACMYPP
jgi:hypothetical protein